MAPLPQVPVGTPGQQRVAATIHSRAAANHQQQRQHKRAMAVNVRSHICVALGVCPWLAWQQKTAGDAHCRSPTVAREDHIYVLLRAGGHGRPRRATTSRICIGEALRPTAALQGPRVGTGGDALGSPKSWTAMGSPRIVPHSHKRSWSAAGCRSGHHMVTRDRAPRCRPSALAPGQSRTRTAN